MARKKVFEFEPAQIYAEDIDRKADISLQREDTRSSIAKISIAGYLAIVFCLIAAATFTKLPADVAKDYLLAVGSPLGFVIGYYFKSVSDKE